MISLLRGGVAVTEVVEMLSDTEYGGIMIIESTIDKCSLPLTAMHFAVIHQVSSRREVDQGTTRFLSLGPRDMLLSIQAAVYCRSLTCTYSVKLQRLAIH